MEKNNRLSFGLDFLILSTHLEGLNEGDKRNERASRLIKKASIIYIKGGETYDDMINTVGNNAFLEYTKWYKKNIFNVVKKGGVHLSPDYEGGPVPKYDVNKYDIGKYFNGLNKDVFEELQKMIMFLFDPGSEYVLEKIKPKEDDEFVVHTRNLSVLAHSILISCLEGGEFLDRLENIFQMYQVKKEDEEELIKLLNYKDKNRGIEGSSAQIAYDFMINKANYN